MKNLFGKIPGLNRIVRRGDREVAVQCIDYSRVVQFTNDSVPTIMTVSGEGGRSTVGDDGIAIAGLGGRVRAGARGIIVLFYLVWDGTHYRRRIRSAYVGRGIRPDVWYQLNSEGEFIEVPQ